MSGKRTHLLLALAVLLLLAGGCEQQSADTSAVVVGVQVSPDPPTVGQEAVIEVRLEERGRPLAGATVDLEATMTHPGMTPLFVRAEEVEAGLYRAPLAFTMGGEWVLIVRATLADGRELERTLDLPAVRVPDRE